jgi:hypothetical protein
MPRPAGAGARGGAIRGGARGAPVSYDVATCQTCKQTDNGWTCAHCDGIDTDKIRLVQSAWTLANVFANIIRPIDTAKHKNVLPFTDSPDPDLRKKFDTMIEKLRPLATGEHPMDNLIYARDLLQYMDNVELEYVISKLDEVNGRYMGTDQAKINEVTTYKNNHIVPITETVATALAEIEHIQNRKVTQDRAAARTTETKATAAAGVYYLTESQYETLVARATDNNNMRDVDVLNMYSFLEEQKNESGLANAWDVPLNKQDYNICIGYVYEYLNLLDDQYSGTTGEYWRKVIVTYLEVGGHVQIKETEAAVKALFPNAKYTKLSVAVFPKNHNPDEMSG